MPSTMRRVSRCVVAGGAIALATLLEGAQTAVVKLPQRLESYRSTVVRPTAAERKQLTSGSRIAKLLDFDASTEVAVFGAVWIDAPISRYVQIVNVSSTFRPMTSPTCGRAGSETAR
jgi:hypothetical protein